MIVRTLVNVVAVTGTGMLAGVMLTILVTLGSFWQRLQPTQFLEWFSRYGHLVARTVPFALMPALAGATLVTWLHWSNPTTRYIWAGALGCLLGLLLLTAIYNGPMNAQFMSKAVPIEQVPGQLKIWLLSHSFRTAFALGAAVLCAIASSR